MTQTTAAHASRDIGTTTARPGPGARGQVGRGGPVARDLPFEVCCRCGFFILPADLAGDDFRHWHASTCTPTDLLAAAGGGVR